MTIAQATRQLELSVCDDLVRASGGSDQWNRLVDASVYPNVFLRWEWVNAWWKWFGDGRRLQLVVVRNGPDLVGIVPLYVARPGGLGVRPKTLAFIGAGGPTCPEYLGPIVRREFVDEVIDHVVRYLSSPSADWDAIEFLDSAPDDEGTQAFIGQLAQRYPTVQTPGEACPYIELPESFDSLIGRLSRRGRQRRRWEIRRAREKHDAQLDFADQAERLDEAFDAMVELSAASRRRKGEPCPFDNPAYAAFHREVIEHLLPEGIAKLTLLRLEGRPAAFQYGFVYQGKYYYFQTGFDTALDKVSPGGVLFLLMCEHLIEQGVSEFDCLRGDHAYKQYFAKDARLNQTVRVFRHRGAAYIDRWCRTHIVSKLRAWMKAKLESSMNSLRKRRKKQ